MAQPAAPSLSPPAQLGHGPLDRVIVLGERESRFGLLLGLWLALVIHGAAGAQAARNLYEVESFAEAVSAYVRSNLQLQIEIDTTPPPHLHLLLLLPSPNPSRSPRRRRRRHRRLPTSRRHHHPRLRRPVRC